MKVNGWAYNCRLRERENVALMRSVASRLRSRRPAKTYRLPSVAVAVVSPTRVTYWASPQPASYSTPRLRDSALLGRYVSDGSTLKYHPPAAFRVYDA